MVLRFPLVMVFMASVMLCSCGQKPDSEQQKAEIPLPKISKAELWEAKIFVASGGKTSFWDAGEYIDSPERLKLPEAPVFNTDFPVRSSGWTNDYGQLYSESQITDLDIMTVGFQMLTKKAIAIVTIDGSWKSKEGFDTLVQTMAKEWKLDNKADGKILIGISSTLNKVSIVCSSSVDEKLNTTEKKQIINRIMLPEFSKGNYFEGTKKGLEAIMRNLY